MTVIHLKKKDIVKSEVRGVDLEFDNEKLATILGVHGKNGICEYIEEVWEESEYTKPLEITGRFANDATDHEGRKSAIDRDETFSKGLFIFTVMKNVIPRFGKRDTSKLLGLDIYGSLNGKELTGEDGIWWIGSGENRRRDDDEATQEEEAEGDDEGNKDDFGREAIIDEASC
ncbi:hypothetical protein Dimus_028623 [Dionaea muscipula]